MTRNKKGASVPGDCVVFHPALGGGSGGGFFAILSTEGGSPLSPRILAILFGTMFLVVLAALSPSGFSDGEDWALLLVVGCLFALCLVSVHCVRIFPERIEYETMLGSRTREMRDLVRLEKARAWFSDGSELDLRRYSHPARIFRAIARHRPDLAEGVFSAQELSSDSEGDAPPEIRAWSIAIGVGLAGIFLLILVLEAMMR